MALVATFRIPKYLLLDAVPAYGSPAVDQLAIKRAVHSFIETGLTKGFLPAGMKVLASVPTERINLSLSEDFAPRVRELALASRCAESEICQQIAIAAMQMPGLDPSKNIPAGAELLAEAWRATGKNVRATQAAVYLNIKDALSGGCVGLVEASTGVGKTLAMLIGAEDRLRQPGCQRVVITTPTIALLRQFMNQYNSLDKSGFDIHPVRALLGQGEFVSREELLILCRHAKYVDHQAVIEQWVSSGGKPLPGSPINNDWLAETLRAVAPGFPVELCAISATVSEDDPGWRAYQSQFVVNIHPEKEIVLCSHAMLARSIRTQIRLASRHDDMAGMKKEEDVLWQSFKSFDGDDNKEQRTQIGAGIRALVSKRLTLAVSISADRGRVPLFQHLLIDEAHQFESSVASANTETLSIHSFMNHAKDCVDLKAGVTKAMFKNLTALVDGIRLIGEYSGGEKVMVCGDVKASTQAISIITEIVSLLANIRLSAKPTQEQRAVFDKVKIAYYIFKAAISTNANARAELSFSPVRLFPQLHVGVRSVDSTLAYLWASVRAAACVSATLYLPKADGYSAGFQAGVLNIPKHRAKEFQPVTPAWLFAPVKGVWIVPERKSADGTRDWLRPPSRMDGEAQDKKDLREAGWLDDVAALLGEIHATAVGGVMCLMTSYDSVKKLAGRLPETMQSLLVVASPEDRLADQATKFMKLRKQGKPAIWLATGAAWTGLDVGGHDPWKQLFGERINAADDNVLTDLLIPRIPYGLNRTMTHSHRIVRSPAIPWELLDAVLRLKQGVGRIVREEGLPQTRRIFMSDARIHSNGFRSIKVKIQQLFSQYRVAEPDFLAPK